MVRVRARGTIVVIMFLLIIGLWITGIISEQIGKIATNNYVQKNHGDLGLIFVKMDFSAAHGGYFAVFKDDNGEVYNFLMHSKLFPITVLYDPLKSFEINALSHDQLYHTSERNQGNLGNVEMAIENDDVVWTSKGINNLEKLNFFVENVQGNVPDRIRVVCFTREGDPIIMDLEYDGEKIELTTDSTRDKFSANASIIVSEFTEIAIEKRYSEHYKGYFIEYLLKSNKDYYNGEILAQFFEEEQGMKY